MATTWSRLKTWVAGEVLTAADQNAEFNRGVTTFNDAFDITTGHDHDGTNSKLIDYVTLTSKPVDLNAYVMPVVGVLVVGDDAGAVWHRVMETSTIVEVQAAIKTAPTGANIILDVETSADGSSWSSIWTAGNRLNIVAGAKLANTTVIDTPTITKGHVMRVNIDQIGSTIAGSDLTVNVIAQTTL
jgi:hypothetical protein